MKTTININGKDVEIELTKEQIATIKKQAVNPMDYKSYEEICAAGGIDPVKSLPFSKPVSKKQVSCNGVFKLLTIFDAFNFREEFKTPAEAAWDPDYSNSNQEKWYPWHSWSSVGAFVFDCTLFTDTFTTLGSRLCTNTQPKAKYISTQFNAEWNEFLNPKI